MDIVTIVTTPFLGAIIGYFTNWIAIKMLFKPHAEKYFFGIKLPFTPGLIPKERHVLAKKIGETTSQHVLTDDVLAEALVSDELNEKLESAVDDIILGLKRNNMTIAEVFESFDIDYNDIFASANEYLIGFIRNRLCSETFIKGISDYISDYIEAFLKSPQGAINSEKIYEAIKGIVDTKGKEILQSEDFSDIIENYIMQGYKNFTDSEKIFSDILPDKLAIGTKELIKSKIVYAGGFVEKFIEDNPEIDKSLRLFVSNVASENFGKFLGIFINYDKIYDNIKKNLYEYLANTENQDIIVEKLNNGIDKFIMSNVNTVLSYMPQGIETDISDRIINFAQNADKDRYINKLMDFVQNKLYSVKDIDIYKAITAVEPDFHNKLNTFIYKTCENIMPDIVNVIGGKLPGYKQKLLVTRINSIMNKISLENELKIKNFAMKAVKLVMQKGGGYVMHNINFEKMIEDRINDFEIDTAEKIIISVVHKELSAITWLGGLLGLVIGFVPVITSLVRG